MRHDFNDRFLCVRCGMSARSALLYNIHECPEAPPPRTVYKTPRVVVSRGEFQYPPTNREKKRKR
jgi:hypothetical protein